MSEEDGEEMPDEAMSADETIESLLEENARLCARIDAIQNPTDEDLARAKAAYARWYIDIAHWDRAPLHHVGAIREALLAAQAVHGEQNDQTRMNTESNLEVFT